MKHFQWEFICDPSDLVHFRKRIGEKGVEEIFQTSIAIHGKESQDAEIIVDTTAREKSITFTTDSKVITSRQSRVCYEKRNTIEAVNRYLKHDFRILRNYLKGTKGDTINLLPLAAAYNLRNR